MANLDEIGGWLDDEFPRLVERYDVPGAAIAVSVAGEVADAAAGVLSRATGVEATTDSVFQIGSITKVWTTTLAMQLADEGALDPDAPVRRYLPDFRVARDSEAITVRQLMCHTAGFEGDLFTDTGRGDDCVEKYVPTLAGTAQLFPPGEMFSYNNAGFVVLGRIVEVLRDKPFDRCLHDHLATPLGLTHFATCADEAILHRAAVGHLPEGRPAPVWGLARSNGPAGSQLAMRPRDLLAFANLHQSGGTAPDGTALLSAASVKAMRERQVGLPPLGLMGTHWGLGWELYDWPDGTVIGHDGGTIGQAAFLRIVPDRDVAIALLTNGGDPIGLHTEVYGHLLRELAGIELPPLPVPPAAPEPFDAARYLGTYSSEVADLTVTQDDDGRVWLDQRPKGVLADLSSAERGELVRLDDDVLIPLTPAHGVHLPHVFLGDDGDGRARFLHTGRATRRSR
ncbi:serine hydrolase domain-containing protein [Amycolatopsis endophytica]|uniref:CubicO group peptidase (Beta-lactamase class C family) n=1 Tax=Amycolatopsis endophytica TaxID=860233 RepID=A0A853BEM2_9PSEU|nr:serine hydrolase domain-containing protein [Amycolatopsis endophytica]NYI93122.1 CubicO group peptidase (beta-lactamase class C family) [Amycolatopsis endophytica]